MLKTTQVLFFLFLLAVGLKAQSNNQTPFPSNPDGFRDFTIDKTTTDEVVKSLGKPEKDGLDKLEASKIGKWLDAKHKEKIFRQLTYSKVGDFHKMGFSFLEDKLVMIELEFKRNVSPERLSNIFAVEFALIGGPASLPDKPGQYPIPFYATTYPDYYSMVGISAKTFIFVNCISSRGEPGRIERTRQVSRVLERK
ncbi:MAG TPA: hypothetical protein VKA70_19880 [Blastocatellia bacterium]|nr:hypothetical protein [Blastocatellia bacterium]